MEWNGTNLIIMNVALTLLIADTNLWRSEAVQPNLICYCQKAEGKEREATEEEQS